MKDDTAQEWAAGETLWLEQSESLFEEVEFKPGFIYQKVLRAKGLKKKNNPVSSLRISVWSKGSEPFMHLSPHKLTSTVYSDCDINSLSPEHPQHFC